jgi:hypothetical protein
MSCIIVMLLEVLATLFVIPTRLTSCWVDLDAAFYPPWWLRVRILRPWIGRWIVLVRQESHVSCPFKCVLLLCFILVIGGVITIIWMFVFLLEFLSFERTCPITYFYSGNALFIYFASKHHLSLDNELAQASNTACELMQVHRCDGSEGVTRHHLLPRKKSPCLHVNAEWKRSGSPSQSTSFVMHFSAGWQPYEQREPSSSWPW